MAWEEIINEVDKKPSFGERFDFDFASLPIQERNSIRRTVFLGYNTASEYLGNAIDRDRAGYAAYIEPDSVKIPKRLFNLYRSYLKDVVKTLNFEKSKLEPILDKKTKSCQCCKVKFDLQQATYIHERIHRRIKDINNTVYRLTQIINDTSNQHLSYNTYTALNGICCRDCDAKHFLLSNVNTEKINGMKEKIDLKFKDFKNQINEFSTAESKKKNAKIKYIVGAVIHESLIDRDN